MEILLDTHTLIWAILDSDGLSKEVKKLISNVDNTVFVSIASLWEVEIKHIKNPKLMPYSSKDIMNAMIDADYRLLPLHYDHIFNLSNIVNQKIHKDLFDHLLLAVAQSKGMTLISHDSLVGKYAGVKIICY